MIPLPSTESAKFPCKICGLTCLTACGLASHSKTHASHSSIPPNPFVRPDPDPVDPDTVTAASIIAVAAEKKNDQKKKKQGAARIDGRKLNTKGGAKKRMSYNIGFKASIIDKLDEHRRRKGNQAGRNDGSIGEVEVLEGLPQGTLGKWEASRVSILKEAGDRRRSSLKKVSVSVGTGPKERGQFPQQEKQLFELFRQRRNKKRKVSSLWLCFNMRKFVSASLGAEARYQLVISGHGLRSPRCQKHCAY